jgi:hypothetical protein
MNPGVFLLLLLVPLAGSAAADEPNTFQPAADEFAPLQKARYLSGELVYVDPVNRRGAIRMHDNYWTGPAHYFALLPYAVVRYHGAYAELRDLPLGTVVHGYFLPPPIGEEQTIPALPEEHRAHSIAQNHVLHLEDDFSFYQRQGQAWNVVSLDVENEKLSVEPVGTLATEGIHEPYTFDIDLRTRVWQDRRLSELTAITVGMTVQLNLTWTTNWGDREYGIADIWLDDVSREFATQLQRRRHLRYERDHWAPGWIDSVEPFDYGGGIVTVTLFAVDRELIEDLRRDRDERIAVAVAEKTRRTWIHRSDRKFAKLVEWTEISDPPTGSSGVQLRLKFVELLAGYTAGRCVRIKAENWKWVSVPPEERITSLEEQQLGERMVLPF